MIFIIKHKICFIDLLLLLLFYVSFQINLKMIKLEIRNNASNKYCLIIIFCLLFIIIIIIIRYKQFKLIKNLYIKNMLYPKTIIYKGKILLKSVLINDYLSTISDDNLYEKLAEKNRLNKYFNLATYSENETIILELRKKMFELISKKKNKIITHLDIFFISYNLNFGNNLVAINNAIFYCEIVGCHKIIISKLFHPKVFKRKLLIDKPIYDKKTNITIMLGSDIDCQKDNILCIITLFPELIIPEIRVQILKDEIIRNLPSVLIKPNSLYIHIRGGDIFKNNSSMLYAQPPLCFYEKIIKENNYKNIYIISMDSSNIIINNLLNKYNKIIYNKNTIYHDISLLSKANNIVLSASSFALSAIKLNNNLKHLWEYDIMRLSEKLILLHHHLFKYNIKSIIHTMKPSNKYLSTMFSWKRTNNQLKLMIQDSCPNNFTITKPNRL